MSISSTQPTPRNQRQELTVADGENSSTINSVLPPELIRNILHQQVFSVGEQARTREVCKLWADPNFNIKITNPGLQVFGQTFWKEYLGIEIEGKFPTPPNDILEEVMALRECIKGERGAPSCTLVLMPKGLTANKLINFIKYPLKGHSTELNYIGDRIVAEYGDKENRHSYWFLMTNEVIEEGRNKSYQAQRKLVNEKTHGECDLPTYLEALTCCALHHVKKGVHLLGRVFPTYTRCLDRVNKQPIFVGCLGGLCVDEDSGFDIGFNGVVACRKFC